MRLDPLAIPGCFQVTGESSSDIRGRFAKIFQSELLSSHSLRIDFAEEYFTTSKQKVLRGMHFQVPPADHAKMVYCVAGRVLDVCLDIRKGSPKYAHCASVELSDENGKAIYLPTGVAHGFYVLAAPATLVYKVTTIYSKRHDAGIRWDSIGFQWPESDPIISHRDGSFPKFLDFESPFNYCRTNA